MLFSNKLLFSAMIELMILCWLYSVSFLNSTGVIQKLSSVRFDVSSTEFVYSPAFPFFVLGWAVSNDEELLRTFLNLFTIVDSSTLINSSGLVNFDMKVEVGLPLSCGFFCSFSIFAICCFIFSC
jgi:hypothetical protein